MLIKSLNKDLLVLDTVRYTAVHSVQYSIVIYVVNKKSAEIGIAQFAASQCGAEEKLHIPRNSGLLIDPSRIYVHVTKDFSVHIQGLSNRFDSEFLVGS